MDPQIFAAVLAAFGGVAGVWAALKILGPLISGWASSVITLQRDLGNDRERVVANLRAEVDDLHRRNVDLGLRASAAEADLTAARGRVAECEAFIARYIKQRPAT